MTGTLEIDIDRFAAAQRELVRIGIDQPSAHATGSPQDWTDELRSRVNKVPTAEVWVHSAEKVSLHMVGTKA